MAMWIYDISDFYHIRWSIPGYYYDKERGKCTACPSGTHEHVHFCHDCDPGKVSADSGATQCIKCDAGKFASDRTTCTTCPADSVSAAGSQSCKKCPEGTIAQNNLCLSCVERCRDVNSTTEIVNCAVTASEVNFYETSKVTIDYPCLETVNGDFYVSSSHRSHLSAFLSSNSSSPISIHLLCSHTYNIKHQTSNHISYNYTTHDTQNTTVPTYPFDTIHHTTGKRY